MEGDGHSGTRTSARRLVAQRLSGPLAAAAVAVAVAATGYVLIEGWDWFDAIYMSTITLGQVGYGEVHPLTGSGRAWTIVVIVAGFGVFVYSAASLTALFLSGEVKSAIREKARARVRAHLHDHVVICGFGRVGRSATEATVRSGRACVVIDTHEAVEPAVSAAGAVFLCGDARDATVLRHAGVGRAAALITSLDDPSNAVVALTARSLSPDLRIVARATDVSWRNRLMRAGVSHVVPVYESVGTSLAATALDAEVRGVLPIAGTDMRVEEVEVGDSSQAEGLELRALMELVTDVHILGLQRDDQLRRWHEADEPLAAGDMLVVMGSAQALGRLNAMLRHDSRSEA
ncbi:MAG: potassium channel protein [Actinomycetota bacterium]|nr:potassium channel protein [Actinomycetota bacterium]